MRLRHIALLLCIGAAACGSGSGGHVVDSGQSRATTTAVSVPSSPHLSGANLLVATGAGVTIVSLDGTVIGDLSGMEPGLPRTDDMVRLRAPNGAWLRISPDGSLHVTSPPPPDEPVIEGLPVPSLDAEGNGPTGGRWVWAALSPDRRTYVAEWSGACSTHSAWLIPVGGKPRPLVPAKYNPGAAESSPLGWLPDGRAVVVVFPETPCGTAIDRPGTYALSTSGTFELLTEKLAFALLDTDSPVP